MAATRSSGLASFFTVEAGAEITITKHDSLAVTARRRLRQHIDWLYHFPAVRRNAFLPSSAEANGKPAPDNLLDRTEAVRGNPAAIVRIVAPSIVAPTSPPAKSAVEATPSPARTPALAAAMRGGHCNQDVGGNEDAAGKNCGQCETNGRVGLFMLPHWPTQFARSWPTRWRPTRCLTPCKPDLDIIARPCHGSASTSRADEIPPAAPILQYSRRTSRGNVKVLIRMSSDQASIYDPTASPDGSYLIYNEKIWPSSVMMLENS